jgi:hypothetical protein
MRRLKSSTNGNGVRLQRNSNNRYRGPFGGHHHSKPQKTATGGADGGGDQDDDGAGSIGSTLSLRDQFDIVVPIKAIHRAARIGNRDLSLADSDVSSITADDRKKFYFSKGQSGTGAGGFMSTVPMCCCFVNGGGESVGHDTFNTVLANASMYTGMAAVATNTTSSPAPSPRLTAAAAAADETRDPPAADTNNNSNADGENFGVGSPSSSSLWACCGATEAMNWCSLSSPTDNANDTLCSGTANGTVLSTATAADGASPQSNSHITASGAIHKGGARSSGGNGTAGYGEVVRSTSQYSLFDALSTEEAEWCGVHGRGSRHGASGGGGGFGPGALNWRASIRKAMPWSRKNGNRSSSNNNNNNTNISSKPMVVEERQDTCLRII